MIHMFIEPANGIKRHLKYHLISRGASKSPRFFRLGHGAPLWDDVAVYSPGRDHGWIFRSAKRDGIGGKPRPTSSKIQDDFARVSPRYNLTIVFSAS